IRGNPIVACIRLVSVSFEWLESMWSPAALQPLSLTVCVEPKDVYGMATAIDELKGRARTDCFGSGASFLCAAQWRYVHIWPTRRLLGIGGERLQKRAV